MSESGRSRVASVRGDPPAGVVLRWGVVGCPVGCWWCCSRLCGGLVLRKGLEVVMGGRAG